MSINWRTSGQTTYQAWDALLPASSEIKRRGESRACYDAAGDYSKLALGMLKAESSFATDFNAVPASMNNPLNLRPRGGTGFATFASIAACINEWRDRITSPTYAYKDTQTVADLVHVYAPSSDNNDEAQYVRTVETVIASLPDAYTLPVDHEPQDQNGDPMAIKDSEGYELDMTPGLIPEAGYADSLVLDRETNAYDFLGQRVIRGVTLHRMLGTLEGTNTYFHGNAPGLTDMGIDADGTKMYRWNDATGAAHAGVSANRAPWASGPYRAGSAYGDGLKFVNKYGVNAVNRDRRSLEIDGFYGDPWTDDSMREYAQTTAHDAHNYGITWEQFPYSPKDDCSFVCWHNEFCGTDYKECPGSVVMAQTDEFIGIVKGIMKSAQQIKATKPTEPAKPVPVSPYPKGMTEGLAKRFYGSVTVPWASEPFTFDIKRSECRAWLAFCTANLKPGESYEKGNWGALKDVIRRGDKGSDGRVYQWSNGFVYAVEPDDKQTGKAA